MADIDYKEQQQIYEDAREDWELFHQGQVEQEKQFDKNLITIAAGSFGVSLAFIDKIVPIASATHKSLLFASWAFFGVCLVVSLLGFLLSAFIHNYLGEERVKQAEFRYRGEMPPAKKHRFLYSVSPVCNCTAFLSFMGGVVCLIWFVLLNF
jgi:hypothetical protein